MFNPQHNERHGPKTPGAFYAVLDAARGGIVPGSESAAWAGVRPLLIKIKGDDGLELWALACNFIGVRRA